MRLTPRFYLVSIISVSEHAPPFTLYDSMAYKGKKPHRLIYPVHARVYSCCLVNTVMNFRISNKAANCLTSCQTANSFIRSLLNQVIIPSTPPASSSRKGSVGIVSRLRTEQLMNRGSCPSRGKEKKRTGRLRVLLA